MPFWVSGKNAVIGATEEDIAEYARLYHAEELKMDGKSGYQQSFLYFMRQKLKVPEHQKVSVEIGYSSEDIANTQAGLGHPHRGDDASRYIDLSEINLNGLNFSNVSFYHTKFPRVIRDIDFLGAKFRDVDFRETQIINPLVDDNILEGTDLTRDQKRELAKQYEAFEAFAKKNLGQINQSINKYAKRGFFNRARRIISDAISGDTTDIDAAFNFIRATDASGKHVSTEDWDTLREAAFRSITNLTRDVLDHELGKQTRVEWLSGKLFGAGQKEQRKSEIIKAVVEGFKEGDYIKLEFLPREDMATLKRFLESNITDFTKKSPKDIKEKVSQWVASRDMSRWENLQKSVGKFKKAKEHARKAGRTGEQSLINSLISSVKSSAEEQLPEYLSPLEPSAYPAIDPADTAAIARDIYLKQRGAEFLGKALGAAGGAAVASLSPVLIRAYGADFLPNFSGGGSFAAVVGGVAGGAAGWFATQNLVTSENYKQFDNQLGDRLLEIGAMAEILEPHLAYIGTNLAAGGVADMVVQGGPVRALVRTYLGISNAIGLYTALVNFGAVKGEIDAQKQNSFEKRLRPGSKGFDIRVSGKLFDLPKIMVATTLSVVAVTTLISLAVIGGPALGPFFAVVGALPDLALFGMWVAGGTILGVSTYLGYGAVKGLYLRAQSFFSRTVSGNARELDIAAELKALGTKEEAVQKVAVKRLEANWRGAKGKEPYNDDPKKILYGISRNKEDRDRLESEYNELSGEHKKSFSNLSVRQKDIVLEMSIDNRKQFLSLDRKDQLKIFFLPSENRSAVLEMTQEDRETFFSLNRRQRASFLAIDQDEREVFRSLDKEQQSQVLEMDVADRSQVLALDHDEIDILFSLDEKTRDRLLAQDLEDIKEELQKVEDGQFQDAEGNEPLQDVNEDQDEFHDAAESLEPEDDRKRTEKSWGHRVGKRDPIVPSAQEADGSKEKHHRK